ncbi:hypothetical protein QC764_408064 [Podospora pseudoanserina]|uniref:RING-type domain-containing protein n=1 Tax=Podospora pseudoanserina TaxID=2609844 RepID=A0ABR0I9S0_9PEZI|nr:hypothetical protein QC764_408064 [Podospora pseudoanserina]
MVCLIRLHPQQPQEDLSFPHRTTIIHTHTSPKQHSPPPPSPPSTKMASTTPNNTREILTLFSQLVAHTHDPKVTINPPIVNCHLCLEDPEILTPLTPAHLGATTFPGVVLLCGHMVCKPCFKGWHDSIRNRQTNATPANFTPSPGAALPQIPAPHVVPCPICRGSLSFLNSSHCRHLLPISAVPRTLPDGGRAPKICSDCRLLRGRKLGELVHTFKELNVQADEIETEVRSWRLGGGLRFTEEEVRLCFPHVVNSRDPAGHAMRVIRGRMVQEELARKTWAVSSWQAMGRDFGEAREEYMK